MKTGYQVFSSELWNKVKAERGYDSFTDIIREIAQMVSAIRQQKMQNYLTLFSSKVELDTQEWRQPPQKQMCWKVILSYSMPVAICLKSCGLRLFCLSL